MKFRLYSAEADWNTRDTELKTYLGIPDGAGTDHYAIRIEVNNPENDDYEKSIMPVITEGKWKCENQFDASELVDADPTWLLPATGPPGG